MYTAHADIGMAIHFTRNVQPRFWFISDVIWAESERRNNSWQTEHSLQTAGHTVPNWHTLIDLFTDSCGGRVHTQRACRAAVLGIVHDGCRWMSLQSRYILPPFLARTHRQNVKNRVCVRFTHSTTWLCVYICWQDDWSGSYANIPLYFILFYFFTFSYIWM